MRSKRTGKATAILLLLMLSVFWGLNWPAGRFALTQLPVFTLRAISLLGGGAILLAAAARSGARLRPGAADWPWICLSALLNVSAFTILAAYGILAFGAARAAILCYTMPLWMTALSVAFLGDQPSRRTLGALGLGLGGMAALLVPEIHRLGAAPLAALWGIGAAVCWALGTLVMKRRRWSIGVLPLTAWQIALGALVPLAGAVLVDPPFSVAAHTAGLWLDLAYIIVLPIAFSYWAWFRIVELLPAEVAAIGGLLAPVIGVFASGLLLGEPVGAPELTALALVALAVALVLVVPAKRGSAAAGAVAGAKTGR